MMDPEGPAAHPADPEPSEEGLRQVLLRLTRPGYEPLQEEIEALRLQIQALEELRGDLQELRLAFTEGDEDLLNRIDKIVLLLEEARQRQAGLGRSLDGLEESLGRELRGLHQELSDPQQVSGRVSPVLVPLLHEHARSERAEFAEALAPAIGPAIRHQLREAREDIIESLYPVIGQIIGKAVSEAFRELTRNIDARLRGRFRFRSSLSHFLARLKGVSEAEILLREALPFSIQHIFLVHRQTGLHLEHISVSGGQTQDLDLISGMLTAIRDFVHDSFRDVEGDLEEITLGEHRILLEAGQFAYLAVVLKGIEPPGYNERIHRVIHSINIQHERALSGFIGDMHALPDLKPALAPLIPSETIETRAVPGTQPLSRSQKWAAGAAFIGITLTLALAVFACVFTVRLWPYAFASQPPAPTQTGLPVVFLPTQTPTPTITLTTSPSPSPTVEASQTPSPQPTQTAQPSPTQTLAPTPEQRKGVALGNLNLREGPGTGFSAIGVLLLGQEFTILDEEGEWLHVSIELDNGETQTGWVWNRFVDLQAGG